MKRIALIDRHEEVAAACGLSLPAAARARQRQFDEPFMIESSSDESVAQLTEALARRGLRLTRGGRFFHVTGSNDKGAAIGRLNALFRKEQEDIYKIGIGDSANDLSMLASVDEPVLVQRPDGRYDEIVTAHLPNVTRARGIGPVGWAVAVRDIVTRANSSRPDWSGDAPRTPSPGPEKPIEP